MPEELRVYCAEAVGMLLHELLRAYSSGLAIEPVRLEEVRSTAHAPDTAWSEGNPAIAVVELSGATASPGELLLISRLNSAGSYVVCFGAAAPAAPLADRCQLLLAGGREILDSQAPDFRRELAATLQRVCEQVKTRLAERTRLAELMRSGGVVGESEAIFAVFRSVERLGAFSELPVLITGETGTGKDLVAQAIHRQDRARSQQPFVPVNCGALDLEMSGSDLFGHRRGSFTGASQDRAGLFRAANHGLLFLDEVGELSLALQAKLLRVLQTRRVLAVGEDREIDVDVRVVAATNRDLRKMVGDGTFREDLFHRLNVTAIHIPPLRERTADIAPLVAHFLARYSGAGRAPLVRAAADVLELLERSRLPGNARQIENLVYYALIHQEGGSEITLRDLPADLLEELTNEQSHAPIVPNSETGGLQSSFEDGLLRLVEQNDWNLDRSMTAIEDLIIRAALRAASGNQSQAARRLGITPRSVYNKLRRSA